MFSEHDSKTKLGYVREKLSKLSQEQFEEILKAFCFISYFEQRYDFDFDYIIQNLKKVKSKIQNVDFDNNKFIADLKSAIALWTEDNGIYSFAHRSLQEYFAALFIQCLNPAENERAYKKIIDRFSNEKRAFEVENFLSLLHEMDEINFCKFYYLPLLKELRSHIDSSNEKNLVSSFVKYFIDGFFCLANNQEKNHILHSPLSINDHVYKGIYVHLPYTRKLHELLQRAGTDPIIRNHKDLTEVKKRPFKLLKLEDNIPNDIFNCIFTTPIIELSKEYLSFLEEKIELTQNRINQSIQTDKDLLDLI